MKNTYKEVHDAEFFNDYLDGVELSDNWQNLIKPTIEQNLPDLKSKRIYEVGFGSGFCLKFLIKQDFSEYVGIDLSDATIPYLLSESEKIGFINKIKLIQGDVTKPFDRSLGRFDFAISTFCILSENYDILISCIKHIYDALIDHQNAEVILAQVHNDFIWTPELIKKREEKYCSFLSPKLNFGDKYKDFTPFTCELRPPFYKKAVTIHDHTISKEVFIKAMKEVGFKSIEIIKMTTTPGKESLLDFADTFDWKIYRCKKN